MPAITTKHFFFITHRQHSYLNINQCYLRKKVFSVKYYNKVWPVKDLTQIMKEQIGDRLWLDWSKCRPRCH